MQKTIVKLENGKTMSVTVIKEGKEALVVRDAQDNVLQAKVVNYLKNSKQI